MVCLSRVEPGGEAAQHAQETAVVLEAKDDLAGELQESGNGGYG